MAGIFDQDPADTPPTGNTPPPSGTSVAPANSTPAATPATSAPANKAKRSFKFPLQGILAVAIVAVLTIGAAGISLPTDQVAQNIGEAMVSAASNSLTTMGYGLLLLMVASGVIGSVLGRRSK